MEEQSKHPLCNGLWRCPLTPTTSGMFVESLQNLSELARDSLYAKRNVVRGCLQQPRLTNGLGQAGDAGNTQLRSFPASPARIAADNGPAERKGFIQSDRYHIAK